MHLRDLLRRAPTIRQWLAMMLAACTVPAAVAVVVLSVYSYQHERAGIERATLDVSRALMQAIDRELASARGALQALATSPNLDDASLDDASLRAFYAQATEVLHYRPGNILVLSEPDGRQVVNTNLPFGVALPHHGNPADLRDVIGRAQPSVSNLYLGPTVQRLLTSVDVPVVRNGRVTHVLSMQYFGERLGAILDHQKMPPDANAAIYDSKARVVWRSRGARSDVGQRAGPALAASLGRQAEGIVDGDGEDGVPSVTVFSRSMLSHWAVAISLHRSTLNAALWQLLAWIGLGIVVLSGLGLALVRAIGARVEQSIRGLVRPAIALGYGAPVTLPALHLREAKDVGHALVQAAALLRERTAQRDDAERARRRLSDAKREIERSEAFLRGIFEETPDGVLLVDAGCSVTRANAQAEELFGYAQGALAGLPVDTLLYETGAAAAPLCEQLRAAPLRLGIDGSARLHGRRRDGSVFPADAMASALRERALVILTIRDMTEHWEQEETLRRTLDDKNTLLKELYHRVKNNLQLVISMFSLQIRMLPESQARQSLQDAVGRVRAMALVHERLYQSRTLSSIALDAYVTELCGQLAGAASAARRGIVLRVDAAPLEIGLDIAVPLGLLLNELVSNSLEHGFPEGGGRRGDARGDDAVRGHILVSAVREGNDMRLSVADDGIGLRPGFDKTSSQTLGLRLVSALSDQLRAHFSIEPSAAGGGVLATLVFSVPAAANHANCAARAPDAVPGPAAVSDRSHRGTP